MAAQILVSLLLNRSSIVFESLPGVRMLLFQGLDLRILFTNPNFQIRAALAEPGVARELGLQ
ncbi:hypothetical protein D3C77_409940 [compost metagenome]